VFEDVLARIRDALVNGTFGGGDRLPSERDLAAQFHVSRPSVREALRVLEALGVVQVRPRQENAILIADAARAFQDMLVFQLALGRMDLASVVEFRIVLESCAARAAAERATDADHTVLVELTQAMSEQAMPFAHFREADQNFHLAIAQASGNALLGLTLEGARTTIERVMLQSMPALGNWDSARGRVVAEHEAIRAAIEARDGERAASLMTAHIRSAADVSPDEGRSTN
jgi:DNA-binding FadR family transcriptional regulator